MKNKYDLFISYSRADFDEVSALISRLKEDIPGLTCWFDITGVESASEFEDKIISAIKESSYVLFALSDNSMQSEWTKDEVTYAKNIGKKVIPVLLKGTSLNEGWFLFKFGRIDCIDSGSDLQIRKLVGDLSQWLNKSIKSEDTQVQDKILTIMKSRHRYGRLKLNIWRYLIPYIIAFILSSIVLFFLDSYRDKRDLQNAEIRYNYLIGLADSFAKIDSLSILVNELNSKNLLLRQANDSLIKQEMIISNYKDENEKLKQQLSSEIEKTYDKNAIKYGI